MPQVILLLRIFQRNFGSLEDLLVDEGHQGANGARKSLATVISSTGNSVKCA